MGERFTGFGLLKVGLRQLIYLGLLLLLLGCGMTARFPSNTVVERAIAMEIAPFYRHLSQELSQPNPKMDITKIHFQKTAIVVLENLPAYHLQGSYNLTLSLPHRHLKENQFFDLYIQQQKQNKSWRLIVPETFSATKDSILHNYLIQ